MTDMQALTRVLLVEDHPILRLGLATLLNAQEDLTVVAEAASVSETFTALEQQRPDLVVLPLRLEGDSAGLELCREIKSLEDAPSVLMYTSFTGASDATLAFLSGADSYLTKDHPESRLLETVRETARGQRVWRATAEAGASARSIESRVEESSLTSREQEVLGFMLQRFTNAEISRELFISIATVKTHVSNVLQKLGLERRMDLFE